MELRKQNACFSRRHSGVVTNQHFFGGRIASVPVSARQNYDFTGAGIHQRLLMTIVEKRESAMHTPMSSAMFTQPNTVGAKLMCAIVCTESLSGRDVHHRSVERRRPVPICAISLSISLAGPSPCLSPPPEQLMCLKRHVSCFVDSVEGRKRKRKGLCSGQLM